MKGHPLAAEQNIDAERAAFNAWFDATMYREDARDAMEVAWLAARRSAAIGEGGLPELPRPAITYADHSYPAYSKKQMEQYARDAIAADREARANQAEIDAKTAGTRMDTAFDPRAHVSPQAAQGVKTWQERYKENKWGQSMAYYMEAEIADLRAQLARAQRALLRAGFQDLGAQEWKPPVNEVAGKLRQRVFELEAQLARQSQSFDQWWTAQVEANGGTAIGADYRHWARMGFEAAAAPLLSSEQQGDFRALVQSIVSDGYLSETNVARAHAALNATAGEQQAAKCVGCEGKPSAENNPCAVCGKAMKEQTNVG
jgi:hypothetical protein